MRTPREILQESATIAVVGASRDPGKSAYSVPQQMQLHGWRIIPVNPYADELFGEQVYRTLADIPGPVDMVDVFRPSEDAADVARQAAAIGAKALWLQQGIVSDEARRIAEAAGMDFVEDHCMAVERALDRILGPDARTDDDVNRS
jgi:predicted CoA-binding protein